MIRVAIVSGDAGGTNYYRAALVKRAMDRDPSLGVEALYTDRWFAMLDFVDVVYLVNPWSKSIGVDKLHALKRAGKAIVLDADDAIYDVPPESPAWAGSNAWEFRRYRDAVCAAADLVTATTAHIGGAFAARCGAPFEVVPNAFDTSLRLAKSSGGANAVPLIGWTGGGQHHGDLAAIDGVWDEILRRGWGLAFMGSAPLSMKGRNWQKTGERVLIYEGTATVEQYLQAAPLLGIDVGLAPLLDNEFNRCKSQLKPLEYWYLCGVPAVASDVECYRDLPASNRLRRVDDFDTSVWMAAIEAALEVTRTEGRRYWLPDGFSLAETAPKWAAAFRRAITIATGRDG